MTAPLATLRNPIDVQPVMRRWIGATRSRLVAAILAGQEAGTGVALKANSRTTQRIKGHGQVGYFRGRMIEAVKRGGAEITLVNAGATATVRAFAASGSELIAFRAFLKGAPTNILKKRRGGKRVAPGQAPRGAFNTSVERGGDGKIYTRRLSPVPPRDFVGVDERDVEAAAKDLVETALRGWGFR